MNFTVSSTILNTGIFTESRISFINTWRELQGMTIKSTHACSSFLASSTKKGIYLSAPIFFSMRSCSIS